MIVFRNMALFRLFLVVLFFTNLETLHLPNTSQALLKADYMKAINQTVHAIDKLMSFYEEEVNEVNLDAIYGLRVLEGSLAVCLTQHGDSFWNATLTTKYIHQKLSQLRSQAGSINNRAQASIKEQAKEYYFKFKDVVDKPWTYFKDFGKRTLPLSRVKALKVGEGKRTWDEAISDRCMSEAIGSNANHTECMFTPVCIKAITDQKQSGYGPTHQILFLTVAIIHKCEAKYSKTLKKHLGIDVDGLIDNRCVRIMDEMLGVEMKNVPEEARDLYMEQAFVCSLHGFDEFLSLKRLMHILSWQRTPGCFGNEKNHEGENDDKEQRGTFGNEEDEGQKGTLGDNVKDNIEEGGKNKIHKRQRARRHVGSFMSMRRILVDVTVGHGCSAHESGVAAGLLGMYTKWLLTKVATGSEAPIKSSNLTEGVDENTRNYNRVPSKNMGNDHEKDNSIDNDDKNSNDSKNNSDNKNINSNDNKNNNNNDNISNDNNNHNNNNNNNVATKDIYIRSMVISFVTTLLTVAVILSLYKFGGSLCVSRISKRKYRPLVDA